MKNGTLALTRKLYESVEMFYSDENGDEQTISVSVEKLSGNQVRLAINAPSSVKIVRDELLPPE